MLRLVTRGGLALRTIVESDEHGSDHTAVVMTGTNVMGRVRRYLLGSFRSAAGRAACSNDESTITRLWTAYEAFHIQPLRSFQTRTWAVVNNLDFSHPSKNLHASRQKVHEAI